MFQFLQPILLFAIAGIVVPVIIHLWNIKQGKTLKIGSIALLTQGSRRSAKSLKVTDLLLLFLRCLLLILLAFLLAKPVWQKKLFAGNDKGWILLEKEKVNEAYTGNKETIDSLLSTGFQFRYFNTGFNKAELTEVLKVQKDTNIANPPSYWHLLSKLNEEIPASLPVYLFTENNVSRFREKRPELSLNLHWKIYTPKDSLATWPEKAFLTASDSVRLIGGNSKADGTFYSNKNISANSLSNTNYKVEVQNGRLMVLNREPNKNNTEKAGIEVDTSTLRIAVFTDNFVNDANYLTAAIRAIRSFSKRRIILISTNNFRNIPANQDWVFWLSEQPLAKFNHAKNIFKYVKGKAENTVSWIATANVSTASQVAVSISKIIPGTTSTPLPQAIWKDGFGNGVLQKEVKNKTNYFHFYSRLDPEWTDLIWKEEFPEILFELFFRSEYPDNVSVYDKRIIDARQLQPEVAKKSANNSNSFSEQKDVSLYFWLAAFVIFFIERVLSFTKKRSVPGV
ncbi:MAG TPA: BatA domain-containing protein [Segetibacter sp.]